MFLSKIDSTYLIVKTNLLLYFIIYKISLYTETSSPFRIDFSTYKFIIKRSTFKTCFIAN